MAVVPMQTSERRLSAVVSVNNQQLLVVGWISGQEYTFYSEYVMEGLTHENVYLQCCLSRGMFFYTVN
jgi:hypothetical protein